MAKKRSLRHRKDRKVKIPVNVLVALVILASVLFLQYLNITGFSVSSLFVAEPPITIDGDFADWTPILADSSKVILDGPFNNLTDLDSPDKPARNLARFASTHDDDFIYFYFERGLTDDNDNDGDFKWHARVFVYIDSNNNGFMEAGEPVISFKWHHKKRTYDVDVGIYKYTPASNATSGDTMACGDGCTMPGKQKKVWKKVEKLQGSSADSTKLETRIAWDWLNVPIDPECKSCKDIFSLTMGLSEPLNISSATNISVYDTNGHLLQKIPITPGNLTWTVTSVQKPIINITVDGTNFTEEIETSCSQPIGENFTFDEFDIMEMDASEKKECVTPIGVDPHNVQFHISSTRGNDVPHQVKDNLKNFTLIVTAADTTPPQITNTTTVPTPPFINNGSQQNLTINFNSSEFPITIILNLFNSTGSIVNTQGPITVTSSSGLPVNYAIPPGLQIGNYTLNATITDPSGNSVTVTVGTFGVTDLTPPNIVSVPTTGLIFNVTGTANITAQVTDPNLDTVLARITNPNGTATIIKLLDPDHNNFFDGNFTNTSERGVYNLTIIANDTLGNTAQFDTFFEIKRFFNFAENVTDSQGNQFVTEIIIYGPNGTVIFNSTSAGVSTAIPEGIYNITVTIIPTGLAPPVLNITFVNILFTGNINQLVDLEKFRQDITFLDPNVAYNDIFAMDFVLTAQFDYILYTAIADGPNLYKCRVFDFETRQCLGQWIKIRSDLVPGQTYTLQLRSAGDPAFGEGSDALVLKNINIDGNFTDWAAVLDNANNVGTDGISGSTDLDTVTSAGRDLTKFAFTWNDTSLFLYFKRLTGPAAAVTVLAYIDRDADGFMNATDKIAKFRWSGSTQRYDLFLSTYTPSNLAGDALTGDGVDMPGNFANETLIESNILGGGADRVEMESRINWTLLNLTAGSPLKIHVSSTVGDGSILPAQVEDNMNVTSTLISDVDIFPDNTGGAKANSSKLYNHTIKNLGNKNEIFDVVASSNKGFNITLRYANGTLLADTNANGIVDTGLVLPSNAVNITVNISIGNVSDGTIDVTTVKANTTSGASDSIVDVTNIGDISIIPRIIARSANSTTVNYNHTIINNLGSSEVLDINATSSQGYTVNLLYANGTALSDTNGNSKIDVGTVTSGGQVNITVRIVIPNVAFNTIDNTKIAVNASSDPTLSGFATDKTTVAAPIEVEPDHADVAGIGAFVFYEHEVFNNQNVSDTIDINTTSSLGWGRDLFQSDKFTPLNNTDGDSLPDTGVLAAQGSSAKVVVKVTVPTTAAEGNRDTTKVTGTASASSAFDDAFDNTTAQKLITFNDSARTLKDDLFDIGETVYAKAFGLLSISNVRFIWIDGNETMVRTSPSIAVDGQNQATDEFATNSSHRTGNWTLILTKTNGQEITRRSFLVREANPPSITFIAPTPANGAVQTGTSVTINLSVTDESGIDTCILTFDGVNTTMTKTSLDGTSFCNATKSGLSEGAHSYKVIVSDLFGNTNESGTRTVAIDNTKPLVQFVAPTKANNTNVTGIQIINVTSSDANLANITIFMNNSLVATCFSSPCSFIFNTTRFAEVSTHNFTANATDLAGSTNATGFRFYKVDNKAPNIAFVAPTPANNSFTRINSVVINTTVFDLSGVDKCTLNFDGASTSVISPSAGACNFTVSSIAEGRHNFTVFANDTTDPTNSTPTFFFTVDTAAPRISTISPTPANNSFVASTTVVINSTVVDLLSSIDACTLKFDGVNETMTKVGSGTSVVCNKTKSGLGQGPHNFTIFANDTTSNLGENGTFAFTVDTILPLVQFVAPTPANNEVVNGTKAINITSTDTNLASITIFDETGPVLVCASSLCTFTFNTLTYSNGLHKFNATSVDSAGNRNSTETRTFNVSNAGVIVVYVAPTPANNSFQSSASATINVTAIHPSQSIDTCMLQFDGVNETMTKVGAGTSVSCTTTKSSLPDGQHSFIVFANTTAGETGSSINVRAFTVDTTAPAVSYVAPTPASGAFTNSLDVFVNLTASDTLSSIDTCVLTLDGVNFTMAKTGPGSSVICGINNVGLSDGSHTYEAFVNDSTGNLVSLGSRTVTVDTATPVVSSVSVTSITASSAVIDWTTDEGANSTINFGTTLALGSLQTSSGFVTAHAISVSGLAASTTYYFNVTSCDPAGNCATSGVFNFITASAPVTPPGPGGGGGGGGGFGGPAAPAGIGSQVPTQPNINPSVGAALTIDNTATIDLIDDTDIIRVFVDVFSRAENVQFRAAELRGAPEGTPRLGPVEYKYWEIVTSNLDNKNIENSNIRFRVRKEWVVANNIDIKSVTMYRYAGEWNKLDTKLVQDVPGYFIYESQTPGFSLFGVNATVVPRRFPTAAVVPSVFPWLMILLIALLLILLLLARRRKRKPTRSIRRRQEI